MLLHQAHRTSGRILCWCRSWWPHSLLHFYIFLTWIKAEVILLYIIAMLLPTPDLLGLCSLLFCFFESLASGSVSLHPRNFSWDLVANRTSTHNALGDVKHYWVFSLPELLPALQKKLFQHSQTWRSRARNIWLKSKQLNPQNQREHCGKATREKKRKVDGADKENLPPRKKQARGPRTACAECGKKLHRQTSACSLSPHATISKNRTQSVELDLWTCTKPSNFELFFWYFSYFLRG